MGIQVVGHTSFLGHTGYNSHSKHFFTNLNKHLPVRIRNYTYVDDLSYLSQEELNMIIEQDWPDPPHKIGRPFQPDPNDTIVDIVLNESHHYFFYHQYQSPMIAYNVWEATRQIPQFFKRLLDYDQFWCPTEWQKQCTIEQGYPEERVKVVPEGVNGEKFNPDPNWNETRRQLYKKYNIPEDKFCFMIFGRWDYRKSTTEMFQAFLEEFKNNDDVVLIASVDNPFPSDGIETTEERLKHYKVESDKIRILHFPPREEYIQWIRSGNVFLSCSRSEGWNLPLIEAIASGTPSICSAWSGQMEFADGVAHLVEVPNFKSPKEVFMLGDDHDLGVWGEPDFNHLRKVMRNLYEDYSTQKERAVKLSRFVREVYTWENAALKGKKYIEDLVNTTAVSVPEEVINDTPEENRVKLNLGCGNDIIPGYINIDKYNNTGGVDINCDIMELPFEDGTVDEIYISHVFEHIPINDTYIALDEWHRVLKVGGTLEIRIPDLEHEVKEWLSTPDDEKWFKVHLIFGSQSHEGNTHFCGFNPGSLKSFLEMCGWKVDFCGQNQNPYRLEIKALARKLPKQPQVDVNYITHFVDGAHGEVTGPDDLHDFFLVDFIDQDKNSNVHQQLLRVNNWTKPHRKFFTNWLVQFRRNGKIAFEHKFDAKGRDVLISFDTKSMGDTIAWMPYVEEFRKSHNCKVYISTFWNHLFKGVETYKNLNFILPGTVVNNLYASYNVGCFDGNQWKNKIDWRLVPLQKVCSDFLGLEYEEIVPDIIQPKKKPPIKEKYVAISEFSTFQSKFWNYPNGWQIIVDFLNEIGYKVISISKEETKLKNVIKRNNKPIEDTINTIQNADFFMGISCGPSWLAWALKVPVVLISGYSAKWGEFSTGIKRVINEDVCHGCFNDPSTPFERGDWNWCPRQKGTTRQFECTLKITPEMVMEAIEEIIKEKKNG